MTAAKREYSKRMSNEQTNPQTEDEALPASSDRRKLLRLGALAVPAAATLTPSMAMATYGGGGGGAAGGAAISLMLCTIPMPAYIDEDGYPVDGDDITEAYGSMWYHRDGAWRRVYAGPDEGSYVGETIKQSSENNWAPPPGVDGHEFDAHLNYLYRIGTRQIPGAGLTCLVSLQNGLNLHF